MKEGNPARAWGGAVLAEGTASAKAQGSGVSDKLQQQKGGRCGRIQGRGLGRGPALGGSQSRWFVQVLR